MAVMMKATKCPTDELSLKNRAIVNSTDFPEDIKYIDVSTAPGQHFIFSVERCQDVSNYCIGFSLLQRKWATLSINQDISVKPFFFERSSEVLCNVCIEVDFLQKKTTTLEPYDSDQMAKDFVLQFSGLALTVGQPLVFSFQDKKLLGLCIKSLDAIDASASVQGDKSKQDTKKTNFGRLLGNTTVTFEKAESSSLNLVGKAKGKIVR